MTGFRRNRGTGKFGLFAELIIIIAGIMVSFLLNEWRESRNNEETKLVLLEEIQEDLRIDSILLSYSLKTYQELHRGHDSMLTFPTTPFQVDSISMYLDYFISYLPFKPSERAFNTLTNNPELFIEVGDTAGVDYLINQYALIRNQLYNGIHEWETVDKNFVLNTALPYLESNAPYISPPPGKSFHGNTFNALIKKDHFKNLVNSGSLYKNMLFITYKQATSVVNDLRQKNRIFLNKNSSKK